MDKNRLKAYAPGAREKFIKAVSERAAFYGISEKETEPCTIKGDFAFIAGRSLPKSIDKPRTELLDKIKRQGFAQAIEEVSYTWFNRIAAIRFMEVNGYLSHGYRILSHPEGHAEPEILGKAQFLEKFGGLEKDEILQLKMAGNKDNELFRKLLIAQCNELSQAMPFLFERVDDLTELLLPDSLLSTDSVIRDMVSKIPDEDWKEVEIIGWLYQFYISEKKDKLMKAKKAYKTEDIPAVTQLFTPNWIVKYLVQNSLGAKWLGTYPKSMLKAKMTYYIEPAPQDEDVKAKLKEITPSALNPEELTVMDPACGSGHILVEAYDLLKAIYLERGYRGRDIPSLILTKNLFGLEIDERAAQLAGFALVMKAYADDHEIFKRGINPNIVCLKGAEGGTGSVNEAKELVELFEDVKTFGSLIRIPEELTLKLPDFKRQILEKRNNLNKHTLGEGASFFDDLLSLVRQAEILAKHYDCVIANPPYMGGKGMNALLKDFSKTQYPSTKADLFAMFIERGFEMAKEVIGYNAMVTMQSWMFLSSFEKCRELWIETKTIQSMAHLGARAFSTISGEVVTVTAFSFMNSHFGKSKPSFLRLVDGDEEEKRQGIVNKSDLFDRTFLDDFKKIPGSPIAYWVSEKVRKSFADNESVGGVAEARIGMATGCNELYVRCWSEVDFSKLVFDVEGRDEAKKTKKKWFPYAKDGGPRKWYGYLNAVVDWENDGHRLQNTLVPGGDRIWGHNFNLGQIFKPAICWPVVTTGANAFRYYGKGFLFDAAAGLCQMRNVEQLQPLLGNLNSPTTAKFLQLLNPTINLHPGYLERVPIVISKAGNEIKNVVGKLICLAKFDWDSHETSWDFSELPLLRCGNNKDGLRGSYRCYKDQCCKATEKMKRLEEENNQIFVAAYGLEKELASEVPIEEVTLFANPKYRYKGELSDEQFEARFKEDTTKELLGYAVGCMMGRYSLDMPGLVYAYAENKGFDAKKCKAFPADEDGIIPITEREWFDDDAACRFLKFIETAWDKKSLEENLDFIAGAMGGRPGEPSREAIRRYFANDFFKDHCQTYRNRPIYWLFTSGEEKAFQALVYLHRYNEGTLARMRTEYVLPLQTKIMRSLEHLAKDKDAAPSTSAGNKIQKEIDSLNKQSKELKGFDELLRNYADKKIKLDLDDGVKVNYGKFGDLLENVKKIAGSDKDEQREDSE